MIHAVSRSSTAPKWLWPALYLGWIAVCALLVLALRGEDDPSRPNGRLLSTEAGERALVDLRQRDLQRYRDYDVVHVAYAGKNEGGGRVARWVVLCDRKQRTALREAVVVEVDAARGAFLALRAPDGSR